MGHGMMGEEHGGRRMRTRHLQRKKGKQQGVFRQAPFDSPFERRRLLQVQLDLSGDERGGEGEEGSEEGSTRFPRSVREQVRVKEGQAQRVVVFNPLAHEMKRVSEGDDMK